MDHLFLTGHRVRSSQTLFSLWALIILFVLRSIPAPEISSSLGLTCLAGQQKNRFNHPSIEEGMVLRSLAPKHSYCRVITQRVGSITCSASSACILEGDTKLCFTFSKTWDRQLLSRKDLVFGWIQAAVGYHGKDILAVERATTTWSQWA